MKDQKSVKLAAGIIAGMLLLSSCGENSGLAEMLSRENQGGTGSVFVHEETETGYVSRLVVGGKLTDVVVDGLVYGVISTADGSAGAGFASMITGENAEENALYRFDEHSADFIAYNIFSHTISSSSGDVVYKTSDGLFFYDSDTMESTLITTDRAEAPIISPNGTCVVYLAVETSEYGLEKYQLIRWMDGRTIKLHQLDEDYIMYPVGVPDSGEYVYATRNRDRGLDAVEYIYTVTTTSTEIIEEDTGNFMLLNRAQDTMLYYAEEEHIVYQVKGKEKTPLYEEQYVFLDEIKLVGQYGIMPFCTTSGYEEESWYTTVYNIDDFIGQTLLFFGDPALDTDCVHYRTLSSYGVDSNAPNYSLYHGDVTIGDTTIAEDINRLYSENGDRTFYVDKNNGLYVYFNGKDSILLENDIDYVLGIIDGNLYYEKTNPITGAKQFCVHNGLSGNTIFEGEIESKILVRDSIYFYAANENGGVDFFAVVNGNEAKLILPNIIA